MTYHRKLQWHILVTPLPHFKPHSHPHHCTTAFCGAMPIHPVPYCHARRLAASFAFDVPPYTYLPTLFQPAVACHPEQTTPITYMASITVASATCCTLEITCSPQRNRKHNIALLLPCFRDDNKRNTRISPKLCAWCWLINLFIRLKWRETNYTENLD